MNKLRQRQKRPVLYLGEISDPPRWLPSTVHPLINPILKNSRVGVFVLEDPTEEETRQLECTARDFNGVSYLFKAGGTGFCTFIGSSEQLCAMPEKQGETVIRCDDFIDAVQKFGAGSFTLFLRNGSLTLDKRTRIMGILNVTPDSFSDGGSFYNFDAAVAQAEKMAEDGADIIDIGGESTRPGAEFTSEEEEARRVLPVIEYLVKHISTPISIDTCKAGIARRALDAGAQIINDVSALRQDSSIANVAAEYGCPLILMHMLGVPKTMQVNPYYDALIPEIISFLQAQIEVAVEAGVKREQILVDPGIGFGKTVEHNLEIMRGLAQLKALGRPILIGPSRKSTIGKILGADVTDRLEGTAATVAVSIMNGAHIVRVHDVKQMARVAKMTDAILYGASGG